MHPPEHLPGVHAFYRFFVRLASLEVLDVSSNDLHRTRSPRSSSDSIRTTDYRDECVPGFVLRARPSGVHSWRVQLPDRRWLTLGRVDEIALSDAREAAQQRRAKAALGEAIPTRRLTSEATLRTFLADTYEPWMKATYGKRCDQVAIIRAAFRDLLDQKLSDLSTARIDRWRAQRRSHHPSQATKAKAREVSRATINHNVSGLRASLARAVERGALSVMPLGKMKRKTEDENAIVRYLSADEEARLRTALIARDKSRRAGRDSANQWRRERGYEEWPAYGTYHRTI